ncbi:MAG: hypothetical protein JXO22_13290, partial [Phycisphaerae bacterium]|nr:hypothetical protein [Phycisphaerae bacterium]
MRAKVITIGLALLLAVPAIADWDPEMPAKWVQYPDLSPMGIDVNATEPYVLADDFECRMTGPITDIHLWASWYHDILPGEDPHNVLFRLSIHKDIPAEQSPTGYSMPGALLWYREFQPGEFVARIWQDNIVEGWMDPPAYYEFPGDTVCWQYNFYIDEADAFVQEGTPDQPMVYWLDVQALPLSSVADARFGWKTSVDHWNDNAVWGMGVEPYPGPWNELYYPPGHELHGQQIDLAFVITTTEQQDELDWGDAPDQPYPTYAVNNGANHV